MPLLTGKAFNDPYTQDDIPAAPEDVRSATFEQARSDLPLWSIGRMREQTEARMDSVIVPGFGPVSPRIVPLEKSKRYTPAEAGEYMKERGLEGQLTFDRDYNEREISILADRKRAELKRQDILSRAEGGFAQGAGRLGITLATQLLDPLAVGSAFVPVIGEARYAAILKAAGGSLGRAGVRAGVGAAEGAAGSVLLEPLTYAAHSMEQADYTIADSLLNVGVGSIFGGGLHVAGGLVADIGRGSREARVAAQQAELDRILSERSTATAAWWQARADSVSEATRQISVADIEPSVKQLYQRRHDELEAAAKDASRPAIAERADAELEKLDSAWKRAKSADDRAAVMSGDDAPVWQQLDVAAKAEQLEAIDARIADLENRRVPSFDDYALAVERRTEEARQQQIARQEGYARGEFSAEERSLYGPKTIDEYRSNAAAEIEKIKSYSATDRETLRGVYDALAATDPEKLIATMGGAEAEILQLRRLRDELLRTVQNSPRATVESALPATRRDALSAGMGQAATGQPIELRPIFDRSPQTMQAAAKRLEDPDAKDLSDPASVERADTTIAEGETADIAAVQRESELLDAQIKAITDEASISGDDAMKAAADDMNAEIAEVEKLARESSQQAKLLAVCASRHAV